MPKIEITPDMIDAGEEAILTEIGGADLGAHFSAPDLAEKVFLAMLQASSQKPLFWQNLLMTMQNMSKDTKDKMGPPHA